MASGIALVGSGIFAKEQHLPAILATPLLQLKAVYSRSLKSAEALATNINVDLYSDDQNENAKGYEDLLKRSDIMGIIVALPILAQPEYIKKAIAAGKHVLAEKPIAKDLDTATDLLQWISANSPPSKPTYTVAENFRFFASLIYASQQISTLGRVLGFRTHLANFVQPGGKFIETAWRKKPEYQGGFLLDGGVHYIAGTRLLLDGGNVKMTRVSAFSAQLQEHLPPVDTLDAAVQLSNGTSGILSISFGTTAKGSGYYVACEKGTVSVSRGKVVVTRDGKEEVHEFPDEGNGVKQEIEAWAESLIKGEENPAQSAEQALADLEFLEGALKSADNRGTPVQLKL